MHYLMGQLPYLVTFFQMAPYSVTKYHFQSQIPIFSHAAPIFCHVTEYGTCVTEYGHA